MEFVDTPSPNHGVRRDGAAVDMLVIHYTDTEDAAEAIDILTDPAAEVSAHYLIDEDGSIHRMVEETRRAWHAGLSSWRGRKDVNSCSIGIELVNPGLRYGYRPFPEVQMEALAELCRDIQTRHRIPGRNVIGVQSKDGSIAEITGSEFDNNRMQLSAYQKNWRYADGGRITAGDSTFSADGKAGSFSADPKSQIEIGNSKLEGDAEVSGLVTSGGTLITPSGR
jgi:N-acetyl-anhydromuramyl-L-alanine amidase AmpD